MYKKVHIYHVIMLHKIENKILKFLSTQIANNIQLAHILVFQICAFMPDDGEWEGPKHVALLI